VALVSLLLSLSSASEVDVHLDRIHELRGADPVAIEPLGARVSFREVHFEDEALSVRWTLDSDAPDFMTLPIVGPGVYVHALTWNGEPLDGVSRGGLLEAVVRVDGPAVLELEGLTDGDPTALQLLGAPRGTVVAPGLAVGGAVRVGDTWWTGAELLALAPDTPPRARTGTLAVAQAGLGLTVGEGEVQARGRLTWEPRQGTLTQVAFEVQHVGSDLAVTGSNVKAWRRSGRRVVVDLREPEDHRVVVDVAWSHTVPDEAEAHLPVPILRPQHAFRSELALQVARDGDLEVLPEVGDWEAIPQSGLPPWAAGLVSGTPTAAWLSNRPRDGRLALVRYVPVPGPEVVVDVAATTIALTEEGRALVRSLYQVRNERAAHLRLTPPEGATLLGARVGQGIVVPVTDDGEQVLVPLKRSVETVQGLLSVPVEVAWLYEDPEWDDREQRRFALPTVGAPVGVERITVYLPPGFRDASGDKGPDRVDAFSEGEGITYGFGRGDAQAVEADAIFQSAVTSWLDNDFDEAQAQLDDLRDLGAESEDIERLQSNLDLLVSEPSAAPRAVESRASARRIRGQARARAADKKAVQQDVVREAQEADRRGDYATAERKYKQALELGTELELLEEEESVDVSSMNRALEDDLIEVQQKTEAADAPTEDWWEPEPEASEPGWLETTGEEVPEWLDEDGEGGAVVLWGQVIGDEDSLGGLGISGHGYGGGGSFGGVGHGSVTLSDEGRLSGSRSNYSADYRPSDSPPPPPTVTASTLSLIVPAVGEAVLYQRLLRPAGATSEVVLEARRTRSSRRTP